MNKRWIIAGIFAFIVMESVAWYALTRTTDEPAAPPAREQQSAAAEPPEEPRASTGVAPDTATEEAVTEFPRITTEVKDGRTERTIHMGVRQWAWDPPTLHAKEGELVRLVIHNADTVNHPIAIPELGVEADVPPEGAVVEFVTEKKGRFFFLCNAYCGEGHALMQQGNSLIIE